MLMMVFLILYIIQLLINLIFEHLYLEVTTLQYYETCLLLLQRFYLMEVSFKKVMLCLLIFIKGQMEALKI